MTGGVDGTLFDDVRDLTGNNLPETFGTALRIYVEDKFSIEEVRNLVTDALAEDLEIKGGSVVSEIPDGFDWLSYIADKYDQIALDDVVFKNVQALGLPTSEIIAVKDVAEANKYAKKKQQQLESLHKYVADHTDYYNDPIATGGKRTWNDVYLDYQRLLRDWRQMNYSRQEVEYEREGFIAEIIKELRLLPTANKNFWRNKIISVIDDTDGIHQGFVKLTGST